MALTDNLVSVWELTEASGNALDSYGSNTLTDNNTVGATTGKIIGSRDFERSNNEFFHLASNSDLQTGDIDFTFSMWVNIESTNLCFMLAKGSENEYGFTYNNNFNGANNRFAFYIRRSVGLRTATANNFGAPSTGTWYFVVGWHDAAGDTVNISVNDGTPNSTATGGAASSAGSGNFTIGSLNLLPEHLWDGQIEQVAFWKRVLTSGERTQLYNSGNGLEFSEWLPGAGLYEDLVSYWRLDEASGNAIDAHRGNDLTDTNTVATATGIINGGRDFESGNTEYFTIADNSTLRLGDIDATISVWVKLESKAGAMAIVSKWDTSSNREYELLYFNTTDRFLFQVSTTGGDSVSISASTLGSPSTGVWYHIVAEHDSTANEIRIRVNNGTPDVTSHSGGVRSGTSAFRLGNRSSGSVLFDGIIDECGLWKRLLTSDELTALYNSGSGLSYDDFGDDIGGGGGGSTSANLLLLGVG